MRRHSQHLHDGHGFGLQRFDRNMELQRPQRRQHGFLHRRACPRLVQQRRRYLHGGYGFGVCRFGGNMELHGSQRRFHSILHGAGSRLVWRQLEYLHGGHGVRL
jgi:hypothetical protein